MSDTPASSAPTAPQGPPEDAAPGSSDISTPGCPICEFIEAGPCGEQHKVWVACRGEAKEQETDFVQHCADTFRSFFGCMLSHQEYYQPFLDAFHVDTDRSQEAIDKANARKQQEQQEGSMQQPDPPSPAQQQQQHKQQGPQGSSPQAAGQKPQSGGAGASSSKQPPDSPRQSAAAAKGS